jgi:hypothetical protein
MSTTTRPSRSPRSPKLKAAAVTPSDWPKWQQHLRSRTNPQGWSALWPKLAGSPLRLGLESLSPDAATLANLGTIERLPERPQSTATVLVELDTWRASLASSQATWQIGISALAWAQALPLLAQVQTAEAWTGLLDELRRLASDAAALQPIDNPLAHQLLAVELPLTLAYLFPELPDCQALVPQARKLWSWAAEEATDGEGLLPARHLHTTKALLACWTRAVKLMGAMRDGQLEEDVQVQFEWLLRQTLRLSRDDGSLCYAASGKQSDLAHLVKAALQHIDDPDDHALAKAALEGAKDKPVPKKPKNGAKAKKPLPEPFVHSEWSNAALLRGSWMHGAPRFAVAYDQQKLRCELFAHNHVLLSGQWQAEISIDGWKWALENDWEEVCWHTDEDVVYLELETKITDGWKLQRQMMLAPRDKVLLLADTILGEQAANLAYRGTLPLAAGMRFMPADDTREGYVSGKRAQALVMPLALPEWRSDTTRGEFAAVDGALELTQKQTGKRMFAPLWIDLQPDRIRKDCTWRQLTVGEQLAIQPRDVAVAFRAQAGKDQFVLYRSLAPKTNRTFIGQNVVNEFFAARFKSDGTTEGLIEIE